jgi:putative N6-adenine-specific DNA methylase
MQQKVPAGLLWGSDLETQALRMAKDGLRQTGLPADAASWFNADFCKLDSAPTQDKGVLICNPPYGERLGEEESLLPLYKGIGDTMKQKFQGWTGFVLTSNSTLAKNIGLRTARRQVLYNGPLECRLLQFNLY